MINNNDGNDDSWVAELDQMKLGVAGKIAAGKSTFLRNSEKLLKTKGITPIVEQEEVNEVLLNAYINDPELFASDFQTERAGACHHRQEIVMVKRKAFKNNHVALIERPLFENLVFTQANQRSGNLTEAYVEKFYKPMLEIKNNYPCDLIIYLHVTDKRSVHNQNIRARKGEDNYVSKYLSILGECYYNFVLAHVKAGKMLVVDWSDFGKVEDVLKLAADVLSGRKKLPNVTFIDTSSDDELASSAGITRISAGPDGSEAVACNRPSTLNKAYHNRIITALSRFQDIEIYL